MSTDLQEQLTKAVKNANLCEVQRLAALVDTNDASFALEVAAKHGQTQCVQTLIPVANPLARESHALWEAIENKHVACVQLLAPVSKIGVNHMFEAVDSDRVAVIEALIGHIPPANFDAFVGQSLVRAARFEKTNVLKYLVEVGNPQYNNSQAMLWAVMMNHHKCVDVLYPISDVAGVLAKLEQGVKDNGPGYNSVEKPYKNLKERFEADQLRDVLNANISKATKKSSARSRNSKI